jgi:hypothetical protein
VTRRRLISGIGGALLLVGGGVVAVVRGGGYDVPDATRARLVALEPWEYVLVERLARRICAPDAADVVTADDTKVAAFVDEYVAAMPAALRRDLVRFLRFIEQLAPVGVGFVSRFTKLSANEQDRVLASLEAHSSDLIRGGWSGVKALVFMGYYRDPRTWNLLGYDGPRLGNALRREP